MYLVTVHINIYLSEAQNDFGGEAEYQSEVALVNRCTKEKAQGMEYSKVPDNRKYDPPLLLRSAMHTVNWEEGQKITASLKMFEDDGGAVGDKRTKLDDLCFDREHAYDPQVPYIRENWKGICDNGYYTLNFVTVSLKKPNEPREQPASLNTVQATMYNNVWEVTQDNLVPIEFHKLVSPIPTIIYSLQGFEIDAPRLKIDQADVTTTTKSTALHLKSQYDSILYNMWAGWLAIHTSPTLQTGTWSTTEVRHWTESTRDSTTADIKFPTPFNAIPRVVVMLNGFDTDSCAAIRVGLEVNDISEEGFTINAYKWEDTLLRSADVTWVATTEDPGNVAVGYWDTLSVRPWTDPTKHASFDVEFLPHFPSKPRVLVGFAIVNVAKGKELFRSHCIPSNITESGFTANVASWGDSALASAKIAYVAMMD